jgi:hypothetical protein
MARFQRVQHPDAFAPQGDFNEQLYQALKQSPWWMISIAIHVSVFFVLTLLDTTDAAAAETPRVAINVEGSYVEPDDPEPPPEPLDQVVPSDVPSPDPMIVEDPVVPEASDDNDLPTSDPFGNDDGMSTSNFDGPSSNPIVGIGGNAGSRRRGPGGHGVGGGGGGPESFDVALEDALRWLAAHQSPNGGWEAAGFQNWCDGVPIADAARRPEGLGKTMHDAGVSGLALCAFLGAGYTNRGKHPFAKVVSKGLRYLKNVQDPEGCFGPRATQQYIYSHAIATLAMVEAYGMTGSAIWKGSAQRALNFTALARNPYFAWRYGIKPGDNDTSVTGWMMMALKSAKLVNEEAKKRGRPEPLTIDESSFDGIKAWLEKVTDPDTGRVGYVTRGSGPARPQDLVDRFPGEKSESMTAVGVLARVFLGEDPRRSDPIKRGAELCAALPPAWNPADGSIDMYYWYYGTLAMFQVSGGPWKKWRASMEKAIVDQQRKDTDHCQYKGSWDPIGPWGPDGGRVYATAVMAMCLEIYYRYPRVFGTR